MSMRIAPMAGFRVFHLTATSARGQDDAVLRARTRESAPMSLRRTGIVIVPKVAAPAGLEHDRDAPTPFVIRI